jgi:ribose/xylose/arabinose/galactoside ABC-type transport system permease subunit
MENGSAKYGSGKDLLNAIGRNWAIIFLVLEVLFFSLAGKRFFSFPIFQIILLYGVPLFLLAVAQTMVIITGGIDLSIGFVLGLASVVCSKTIVVLAGAGISPEIAIAAGIVFTLVSCSIPGVINGLLIARLKVPPLIATFAMFGIAHGVAELVLGGVWVKNMPHLANKIGNSYLLYFLPDTNQISFLVKPVVERGTEIVSLIPNVTIAAFVVILIFNFKLNHTRFGRYTYAIGGSATSALRAGVNNNWHLIKVYTASAFLASVGGVLYSLMFVTGKGDAGTAFLLDAIVAVVIGGASLMGGKGTIRGSIIGCFILIVLENGLRMMSVSTFDKYIAVGVILVIAVLIDKVTVKEDV